MSSPICQENHTYSTSTVFLPVFDLTAERLIFESFKRQATEKPALAAGTNFLHEDYVTGGVEAVTPEDTAYPFRHERHSMSFCAAVTPGITEDASWA